MRHTTDERAVLILHEGHIGSLYNVFVFRGKIKVSKGDKLLQNNEMLKSFKDAIFVCQLWFN